MGKVLLVCSGGGHLKQLHALAERLGIPRDDQVWVTFKNGLSQSLLADRAVVYVPFAAPRDAVNIMKIRLAAQLMLSNNDFELAISTGSSPAVAVLPVAARRGAAAHYIESAARAAGPSMSGRLVARNRRITTYTQYPVWANDRWNYQGSIFDSYRPNATVHESPTPRKAVVSVGTQEGYGFSRLYDNLAPLLRDFDEVLWQTGPQDVSRWGIPGRISVPHHELSAAVAEADVVIAHSGTGAALTALENGKHPVLVPRLAKFKEHVDDHQVQIAAELSRRGLATMSHAEDLSFDVLAEAAARTTLTVTPPRFELQNVQASSVPVGASH
jgi:UDP-N-acetylglucosamine transferase subunit ALG13